MHATLKTYLQQCLAEFDAIPESRKELLKKISSYISTKKSKGETVNLVYICTHNSRRSHFGQIWAATAAAYYGIEGLHTFSGGTEATAFHPNAINALRRAGFLIRAKSEGVNPHCEVFHDEKQKPSLCFSKTYDDPHNPKKNFAAIMTCGEAEENCPFIPGVDLRIATTYEDPKAYDGKADQDNQYDARCRQIATECLFVFSGIGAKG
jgi:arsenate reductase (thioredoxin)